MMPNPILTAGSGVAATLPEDLVRLSILTPVYGSPESLEPLHHRIQDICRRLGVAYELILVDDRCPLGSWQIIESLAARDPDVVAIRLSRNFGQHAAIQAGLRYARGDWVVVMDCDLQDRPDEIPRLLAKAAEGHDIVRASRTSRRDPFLRRVASQAFYRTLGYLTDTPYQASLGNFGVYRRSVIDAITSWSEDSKYFPAIVNWVGYRQTYVDVSHDARFAGTSTYTFRKLARLAIQVIIGFSDKPLRLVVAAGVGIAALTMIVFIAVLVLALTGAVAVEGWTSIMLSIWFLGGATLTAIGLTGLYVGRILVESKGRPSFIVDRSIDVRPTSEVETR